MAKTIYQLVGEYANAIGKHGVDSEESRRFRTIYAGHAELMEYADGLDRIKRHFTAQSGKAPALTPGPWTYRPDPGKREECDECGQGKPAEPWNYLIEGKARSMVAKVWVHVGRSWSDEANARLLSAAPDLLDALKNLVSLADHFMTDEPQRLAIEEARAAIEKATNGDPNP